MKFKGWSWRLAHITKLPELLDQWLNFYDLETFEPIWNNYALQMRSFEFEIYKRLRVKFKKWVGSKTSFKVAVRRLFIFLFGKPLRPQVGGLGAQVITFNSVIHWMFHCLEIENYKGIQVRARTKIKRRAVAFIVVTQLTFHPLPLWIVNLIEWYPSVHLVTSATLYIVFLGYTVN